MLTFDNVSYCYQPKASGLKDISFSIEKGEFVFITASSSQYKTTFLNLIYGIILPQQGSIKVMDIRLPEDRKKIPMLRRKVGYIFSNPVFFENLTVEQNLKIALIVKQNSYDPDYTKERINRCLSFFPELKADSEVYKLSATAKEKLNILRGIISAPHLILADEPFKNFSQEETIRTIDILSEENNRGVTIIIATSNRYLPTQFNKKSIEIKGGKILSES